MNYYVEVPEEVKKQINSLKDNELAKNIWGKINSLEHNPTKGKHLFKQFYELKAKNYRVYYSVHHGIVLIEKFTYLGRIKILDVGNKNSQRRDSPSLQ